MEGGDMADTIQDVMTPDPRTVGTESPLRQAAEIMRDQDVGSVVVTEGDDVCGIVTDRDIAVRAVAAGRDPNETKVAEVCNRDVVALRPDQSVDDAIRLMRDENIRRLPVLEGGKAVGIVSLGDLAIARDPDSALGDISAAPPDE
jgi:CBS domain-containing protein